MGCWQEMKSSFYSWNVSFVPVLAASHQAQVVGAVSAWKWIRLIPGPWELSFLVCCHEQRQLGGLKPPLCCDPSAQGSCRSAERGESPGGLVLGVQCGSSSGNVCWKAPLGMVFIVFILLGYHCSSAIDETLFKV